MSETTFLGFDPGRLKCGIAVMDAGGQLLYHQVVASEDAITTLQSLCRQFSPAQLIMGDQTTSKTWKRQLEAALPASVEIVLVDERYSSLEARDRYWQLYPPAGLMRLVPKGMRQPPRPVDDIVAVVLIERYLQRQGKEQV
jgi:RNase H-fold protein (predicted Holliday junction resolvase)